MKVFCESGHCTMGLHCRTCRDLDGGRSWRQDIAQHFEVDGIDWPCPLGHPWGYAGKSRGLGDTVAKVIKTLTFGKVKPCSGCKKRQKAWNRRWPYKQGA